MSLACIVVATEEKRLDLLQQCVAQTGDRWTEIMTAGVNELPDYTREERLRWADIVVQPKSWSETRTLWTLGVLLGLLDGHASERLMLDLLSSKSWLTFRKDSTLLTPDIIENLAVLCPRSLRPRLRTELADLDGNKNNSANLFLDLMDTLEATHA